MLQRRMAATYELREYQRNVWTSDLVWCWIRAESNVSVHPEYLALINAKSLFIDVKHRR